MMCMTGAPLQAIVSRCISTRIKLVKQCLSWDLLQPSYSFPGFICDNFTVVKANNSSCRAGVANKKARCVWGLFRASLGVYAYAALVALNLYEDIKFTAD